MNGNTWEIAAAIVATLVSVIAFLRSVIRGARSDNAKDVQERAELEGRAFSAGAASRNDEIALLRSQRDDARRQRDEARGEIRDVRLEAREWEQRYYGLLNRGDKA